MGEIALVLPTSWHPNREEFLSVLGVSPKSLGEHFFGKAYEALFVSSIEVIEEYKKFYSVEYSNLAEYLNIRYGITLNDNELESEKIFLVTWLPQIIDDLYEESELDTVLECIKKLEEMPDEG